jgi:hypothetical protein
MKDSSKTLFLLSIIFYMAITGCNERLYIGEYDSGYKYDYLYPIDISHYDDGYDTEADLYDTGLDVLSEDYSYYETIGDMGELGSYDEGFYNDIELDDGDSRDLEDIRSYECDTGYVYDSYNICRVEGTEDAGIFNEIRPYFEFRLGYVASGTQWFIAKRSRNDKDVYIIYNDGPELSRNSFYVFGGNGEIIYNHSRTTMPFYGPVVDDSGNAYFTGSWSNPGDEERSIIYKYDKNRNNIVILKDFMTYQYLSPIVVDFSGNIIFFVRDLYKENNELKPARYIYKYDGEKFVAIKEIRDTFQFGKYAIVDSENNIYVYVWEDVDGKMGKRLEAYNRDLEKMWEIDGSNKAFEGEEAILQLITDDESIYLCKGDRISSLDKNGKLNWTYSPIKGLKSCIIDENKNIITMGTYSGLEFKRINRCGDIINEGKVDLSKYGLSVFGFDMALLEGGDIIVEAKFGKKNSGSQESFGFVIVDRDFNMKRVYSRDVYNPGYMAIWSPYPQFIVGNCDELLFLSRGLWDDDTNYTVYFYRMNFSDFSLGRSAWPMRRGDVQNTGRVQKW